MTHFINWNIFHLKKFMVGPAWWHSGQVCALGFSSLGFTGSDPGHRPTHCSTSHGCGSTPHGRNRMTYNQDIKLCTGALRRKKEEDWQQMLAQGQSSSPKKAQKKVSILKKNLDDGSHMGQPLDFANRETVPVGESDLLNCQSWLVADLGLEPVPPCQVGGCLP